MNVQAVPIAEAIKKIPGRVSKAEYEIVFLAEALPPLGFKSYYVTKLDDVEGYSSAKPSSDKVDEFAVGQSVEIYSVILEYQPGN